MARLAMATHVTIRVENMFWFGITSSPTRVSLGKLYENAVRLSCSATRSVEKLRTADSKKKDRYQPVRRLRFQNCKLEWPQVSAEKCIDERPFRKREPVW